MDELNKQKKKIVPSQKIFTPFFLVIPFLEPYLKGRIGEMQKFMFMIIFKNLKESK